MASKPFIVIGCVASFLAAAITSAAASFTSADGSFTLDTPSGWKQSAKPAAGSVLTVEKGTARIEIKPNECSTETCIENKINEDLTEIKRKKMQVVGNAYTGEDIKRIEFSTGEPFFYISFYTPKNDFGAGYFLINGKAYSILARNLTYAETDLIFSLISPSVPQTQQPQTPSLEVDLQNSRAYDIPTVPDVQEEAVSAPEEIPAVQQPIEREPFFQRILKQGRSIKSRLATHSINTFVASRMPPYIRQMGRGFDILVLIGLSYVGLWMMALLLRWLIAAKTNWPAANPNSLYPIHFKRLYGTPSLIFRAKDNQGNILISLSSRWDSLFLFSGILLIISTCILLVVCGLVQRAQLFAISTITYDSIYSICSLLIPLGLIIFFCGFIWSQLVLREISLFDRKGKKAAVVMQKGFGLTSEHYEIYFARSKEMLTVTRKRFSFRREWMLYNAEGYTLAHVHERSIWRGLARKLFGHLWGFLRADYDITGQMDSTGTIQNSHAAFNCFTCNLDKPQAINARDLLVLSLLINIRDRDKWYPWFN